MKPNQTFFQNIYALNGVSTFLSCWKTAIPVEKLQWYYLTHCFGLRYLYLS